MDNEFDDLKNTWKAAKKPASSHTSIAIIVEQAKAKKKSTLYFQYGNIVVLAGVLIMIAAFFYYFFPMQELLSRAGVFMMVTGLLVRIVIEGFSVVKARNIIYSDQAIKNSANSIAYFRLRKLINGPITISLVLLYVIGFFMLTPEFLKYIGLGWILVFDFSFVVAAVFLIWQIGKGIRKEMRDVEDMVSLHHEIEGSSKSQ